MAYTDYTHCDHDLFLALNFDGGPVMDRLMLALSGTWMWVPLYLLICCLVLRGDRPLLATGGRGPAGAVRRARFAERADWRRLLLFAALLGAVIGLSDMAAGIFKANGLLGGLLPDFAPRCRPMYTPSLEGLDIAPDSLAALRREGLRAGQWIVHAPREALGGRYGTVSAHAATVVGMALLSAGAIRRRWFTALIAGCTLAICYSRIYLGKHFPLDLLWGALVGAALGGAALACYRRLTRAKR